MPLDQEVISKELVKFGEGLPASLPDYIENLTIKYCQLTINGLEDKEGYDRVHKARMDVRDLRVKIEKKRKELKEDSLAYGRAIDGEAKRINAMIEPIETYLADQEKAIDDEKERIRKAKEEERMAAYRKQIEEENAKKMAEENARLEEARKAQEEAQRIMAQKQAEFDAMMKAKEEELRQKEIQIEAEKIANQKLEASKAIRWENPNPPTPEQQEIMKKNVAVSNTISDNYNRKQELIAMFFEPYNVNNPTHVNAPVEIKHWLYGSRYIEMDQYNDKDIVEYILDAIFPTEVTNGRE
jgi:chemotaxis protein histidine kinase CheA